MKKLYFSQRLNYVANSYSRFVVVLGRDLHTQSLRDSKLGKFHLCNTKCLSFPAGK